MSKNARWIEFKPSEKNLTKVLGGLEVAVMEAVWKLQTGDVKSIHGEVVQKHKVAITTVATVLDRLHQKELVRREIKKGKGIYYEYSPALTRPQFEKKVVGSILRGLFETFGESTISYLIDETKIKDKKALKEFKRYYEKMQKDLE